VVELAERCPDDSCDDDGAHLGECDEGFSHCAVVLKLAENLRGRIFGERESSGG
jgi:hypothetical protein